MTCKCPECGIKIDCDLIICKDCLAEIINNTNSKTEVRLAVTSKLNN